MSSLDRIQMLRMKHLTELLKISRSSVYSKMNANSPYFDPTFPRPIKVGASSIAWSAQSISEWLSKQLAN